MTVTPIGDVREFWLSSGKKATRYNKRNDASFRSNQISSFTTAIATHINRLKAMFISNAETSNCYLTIATELNTFVNGSATRKIFVVFGSIEERSHLFDSTTDTNKELVRQNPKKVARQLTDVWPIGNLKGMTVYFAYKPPTEQELEDYQAMIAVYRLILSPLSADIKVITEYKNTTL